jgi:hypothetical protein
MTASQRLFVATLQTAAHGFIFVRNYSLRPDVDLRCINEIAEALHDVPQMVCRFDPDVDNETELLGHIRLHLSCFEHEKWPGSPNLVAVFNDELSRD